MTYASYLGARGGAGRRHRAGPACITQYGLTPERTGAWACTKSLFNQCDSVALNYPTAHATEFRTPLGSCSQQLLLEILIRRPNVLCLFQDDAPRSSYVPAVKSSSVAKLSVSSTSPVGDWEAIHSMERINRKRSQ